MTNPERGAYTPPTADAPLSFDPRQPVRGARPIPFTLILAVLVVAALVAAVFIFYRSGVREAAQEPVAVGEPLGGIRAAAPNEQQPQDTAAGLQIYQADAAEVAGAAPAEPTFAAPPETPLARPTAPVATTQAPPAQPPAAVAAQLKPTIPAQATPAPLPVTKLAPPPASKPAPPPAAKPPAPTPTTAKKAAEPKVAASGAARVQVGAVSSPSLADKAWSDAVGAAPGLGAGKGKAVEKIEGGSLYRTFVTGFGSRADAQAFCAKLQAAGKGCMVK